MSELDYEVEPSSVDVREPSTNVEKTSDNVSLFYSGESTLDSLDTCSSKKELTLDCKNKNEIDLVSKDEPLSNDNKQPESDKVSDLEEGEISDSTTEENNKIICKFEQAGKCHYGSNCRFIHSGVSAYKMFGSSDNVIHQVADCLNPLPSNSLYHPLHKFTVNLPPLMSRYLHDVNNITDDWEKGLQVAKQLILRAKDKKENDLEFEEKKLYMNMQGDTVEPVKKVTIPQKTNIKNRLKKRCISPVMYTKIDCKSKNKTEHKLKKRKIDSSKGAQSSQSWVDPWRRSRSRNRNSSRSDSTSSSPSSIPYRESYSSCSCSSENKFYESSKSKAKLKSPKRKSKLDRVFARTRVESPVRRRRLSCSGSSNRSLSLRRSPPQYNKNKLHHRRSFSRSPPFSYNKHSRNLSDKKIDAKMSHESPLSIKTKTMHKAVLHHEQLTNRRDVESFDRNSKYSWNSASESSNSNITISSLSCSSLSDTNKKTTAKERSIKNSNLSTVKFTLKKPDKKLSQHDKVFCNSSSNDSYANKSSKGHQLDLKRESEIYEKSTRKSAVKTGAENSNAENCKSVPKQATVKKKFSADEQQLLRFANVGEVRTKTNASKIKKPLINSSKFDADYAINSDAVSKTVSPKKKESRKEMLLKQLKEVEKAIAEKKNLIL